MKKETAMPNVKEVIDKTEERLDGGLQILDNLLSDPLTRDLIELPEVEVNEEGKKAS